MAATSRIAPRAKPTAAEISSSTATMRSNWVTGSRPFHVPDPPQGVGQPMGAAHRHAGGALQALGRQGLAEAELRRLLQPRVHAADRPDLAGEADFAEHHAILG